MGGPLSDYKILELAGIGPGPFAAMMLADMGADVVRVDRPQAVVGFDPSKPPLDALNRGRRSIAIDLKHPEGRQTVLELLRHSDALIEGFRPGVTERLGLGPDDCMAVNPKLVYGRMTGWGQDGPYSQAAGHDINYIALAGTLRAIGRGGQVPVPPLNLVGDFGGGGMLMAFGIVCGLLEAQKSGKGQVVDAAMVDGAAVLTTMFWAFRAMGIYNDVPGTNMLDTGAHFYDVYETADTKYISIGAIERQFYAELCERTGFEADVENPPFHLDSTTWPERKEKMAALIRTKTRDEWCELLEYTDACFAPVLSFEEAPEHPHNKHRRTFVDEFGVVQPAPAPRFSRTEQSIQRPPAHPGQHTAEILREWLGMGDGSVKGLLSVGAIA